MPAGSLPIEVGWREDFRLDVLVKQGTAETYAEAVALPAVDLSGCSARVDIRWPDGSIQAVTGTIPAPAAGGRVLATAAVPAGVLARLAAGEPLAAGAYSLTITDSLGVVQEYQAGMLTVRGQP